MIVEIDLQFLIKNAITAHQYIILKFASENKHARLLTYLKSNDTFRYLREEWYYLHSLGFISELPSELVNVNHIKVTSKFTNTTTFVEDPFDEFYRAYPVKVLRPDGAYDYLRVDQKKCRRIYNNLVVGNTDKHKFIMKALEKETSWRDAHGKMSFMKRMPSWLTSESWNMFTDMLEDEHGTTPDEKTVAYGTSFE